LRRGRFNDLDQKRSVRSRCDPTAMRRIPNSQPARTLISNNHSRRAHENGCGSAGAEQHRSILKKSVPVPWQFSECRAIK